MELEDSTYLISDYTTKLQSLRQYVAAALLQSCPTLCDPIDGSPPGFPSLGFSRQEHWSGLPFPSPMHESESEVAQSCPTLVNPWTAAYQAPLSMGFSREKYWSGVPLPSPKTVCYWQKKKKYRPMEQDRKPGEKPIHI